MNRSAHRRISRIESLLSAEQKKRDEQEEKILEHHRLQARYHASAVAALFLFGRPSITEPLSEAWARALQHYDISAYQPGPGSLDHQVRVAKQLLPKIMEGKSERSRFTEIFCKAPGWFLRFTGLFFDLSLLGFDLPSDTRVLRWGTAGYEESRQWPLLPSGRMTDGNRVPTDKARLWPFPLDILEREEPALHLKNDRPAKTESTSSVLSDRTYGILTAFDVLLGRKEESELSRYERILVQDLIEHPSFFLDH
jgi:hypothetical protein